ncbi:MAG: 5'-nucleotidase C-terminal domain-containing protein, partial [Eubacteriales bacterium]|nr:5'-nucleotidase C-terminal domain-containing protein [Eubacteriales bacterium]
DSYRNYNGDTKTRDKDSFAVVFTGGVEDSLENLSYTKTWFSDLSKKYPSSVILDTGSASLSQPLQMIYSDAPSLYLMGSAGYDWTAVSPALLSEGTESFASMIRSAGGSGNLVPYLTFSNVKADSQVSDSFDYYGVKDYAYLQKYRRTAAVFSVIGKEQIPSGSGFTVSDPISSAKKTVKEIQEGGTAENPNGGADIIICSADFGSGKDALQKAEKLAKNVSGIDLILLSDQSGKIEEKVGSTEIVSVGSGSKAAGVVLFKQKDENSEWKYSSFSVKQMPEDMTEDASLASWYQSMLGSGADAFENAYGISYESRLTTASKSFGTKKALTESDGDAGFGNLLADSYLTGAENLSDVASGNTVSVISTKAVSQTPSKGDVSSSDVMNIFASEGDAKSSDLAMVSFYLNGSDLEKLTELAADQVKEDAGSRLFFGGLKYSYNARRMSGNRTYQLSLADSNGKYKPVSKNKLYRVVTDQITAEQIQKLSDSKGNGAVLAFSMKDGNGQTIQEAEALSGNSQDNNAQGTVTACKCAVSALQTFGDSGIPSSYYKKDGRVEYTSSFTLSGIFEEANGIVITIAVIAGIAVLAVIIFLIVFRHIIHGSGTAHRRRRRSGHVKSGKFDSKTGRGSYRNSHEKPIFTNRKHKRW